MENEYFDYQLNGLKNIDINNIEKITEKWKDAGFLENVKNPKNVALSYEVAANYLINECKEKKQDCSSIIFSVIKKMFDKKKIFKIEDILNIIIDICDDLNKICKENGFNNFNHFDEDEFVKDYYKNYKIKI